MFKMAQNWHKLFCKREELQLLGTLNGGQSFRWKQINDRNVEKWIGVFARRVWILKQEDDGILYQSCGSDKVEENKLLTEYFQLDLDLKSYFAQWSLKDPVFKKAASQFYGIRILKQDLVENIFSFICSSNNNIARITRMVETLCKLFGNKICEVDGQAYYDFPKIEALVDDQVEGILRNEGFGYRAKYIAVSAKLIMKNGNDQWLKELRSLPYEIAREKLKTLTGIGPKVADCICLMSLGHLQAIPVDTHVYQIAKKFYLPKLNGHKSNSVSGKLYKEIGDHFRELYGPLAGWAHTVLFCADLKKFQEEISDKD